MQGAAELTRIPVKEALGLPGDPPGVRAEPTPSFFDSPLYLRAWHEHLLGSRQLWDLTFLGSSSDGGFIAPLVLQPERHLLTSIRALKPTGWGPAFSSSVCIPFDFVHLECLVHHLLEKKANWDTLEFSLTVDSLDTSSRMMQLLERMGLRAIRHTHIVHPYVRFGVPWEVYYRRRSKSFRNDIVRLLYRMERAGGWRLSCATGDEASNALGPLFEFHRKRWGLRGQVSHYAFEHERNFMKALAHGSTAGHGLWVYSLALGETIVASAVCLAEGPKLQYYETSFDPDFSEFSPGKVLMHCIVRDACEKGFEEVDLGPGNDGHCSYKRWWATGENFNCRFLFAHSRLFTARLHTALWLEPRVVRAKTEAKTLLRRLGVYDILHAPGRTRQWG